MEVREDGDDEEESKSGVEGWGGRFEEWVWCRFDIFMSLTLVEMGKCCWVVDGKAEILGSCKGGEEEEIKLESIFIVFLDDHRVKETDCRARCVWCRVGCNIRDLQRHMRQLYYTQKCCGAL